MAPNPVAQCRVLGGGPGSLPLLHFPFVTHVPEVWGTAAAPCAPPALGASHASLSYTAAHFPLLYPPLLLVCALQSGTQSLFQVGFPLVSTSVQSKSLFHSAGLLSFLCLGFFVLKSPISWGFNRLMRGKCLEQDPALCGVGCCYFSSCVGNRHCAFFPLCLTPLSTMSLPISPIAA